ncbi:hypothetical protein L596_015725 [Steinernema carpocapsae]|uniref:7TM GPCR serpentine receptor class x (Srx) domain-containing protein n=1 Tax=Steinernema carpocapsae TaxID=34508 RepID=A0A4U5NGT8_STECR|nr:hypothetical protein L596_015725 [Steinernema carpocapsae]
MLLCKTTWGLCATRLGMSSSFVIVNIYGATLINKILHYSIEETSSLTTLRFRVTLTSNRVVSFIISKLTCNEHQKKIMFPITTFQVASIACFFTLSFITENHHQLSTLVFTVISAPRGNHCVVAFSAAQIIAHQFNFF